MGRKTKANNAKKGGKPGAANPGKNALNKSKKEKNIFKVTDVKNIKKPKEVKGKLKQIKEAVKSKQEKVDASLKELHKDMVIKKAKPTKTQSPIKAKKAPANTKNVSDKLGSLKV